MGKGIVKKKPFITSKNHSGTIKVTELHPGENPGILGQELAFDMPGFLVEEEEYVEFINIAPGEAHATKKILFRGIVREATGVDSSPRGLLMITMAIPNEPALQVNEDLEFYNFSGQDLHQDDFVEFRGMVTPTVSPDNPCMLSRRIEYHGDVTVLPAESPGEIMVNQVGNDNLGITVNTPLRFIKPAGNFDQLSLGDTIEFKILSNTLGEFVQVLSHA